MHGRRLRRGDPCLHLVEAGTNVLILVPSLTLTVIREFILEYLALVLTKVYNVAVMVPRWLLLVITGSIASVLVNLLHNSNSIFNFFRSKKPAPKLKSTVQGAKVHSSTEPVPTAEVVTVASGSKTSKSGASKRKVTKK